MEESVGGHPLLDFLNTCGGAGKERDVERMMDWQTALKWSHRHGLLTSTEKRALDEERWHPVVAVQALRDFRETVHAVLSAIANGRPVPSAAHRQLRAYIVEAIEHADLRTVDGAPVEWHVALQQSGSGLLRDRLALAAYQLLSQANLASVRECNACSWHFLDLSRSKSRRWCSMATCGNRAKAQRHYRAMKAGG